MQFRQNSLNFTHSLGIIRSFAESIPPQAGLSFVRIDNDDFHPLYQATGHIHSIPIHAFLQLSMLSANPSDFHESQFCAVMWDAFRLVQQRGINGKSVGIN
jgi:hypothetical protein